MRYIIPELLPMVDMKRTAERRHKDVFNHVMQVVDKSPRDAGAALGGTAARYRQAGDVFVIAMARSTSSAMKCSARSGHARS